MQLLGCVAPRVVFLTSQNATYANRCRGLSDCHSPKAAGGPDQSSVCANPARARERIDLRPPGLRGAALETPDFCRADEPKSRRTRMSVPDRDAEEPKSPQQSAGTLATGARTAATRVWIMTPRRGNSPLPRYATSSYADSSVAPLPYSPRQDNQEGTSGPFVFFCGGLSAVPAGAGIEREFLWAEVSQPWPVTWSVGLHPTPPPQAGGCHRLRGRWSLGDFWWEQRSSRHGL